MQLSISQRFATPSQCADPSCPGIPLALNSAYTNCVFIQFSKAFPRLYAIAALQLSSLG